MPRKVVDLSARSEILREEPFHLHFWEASPREILRYLRDPRSELRKMGIDLPEDCRIETTLENHDWVTASTKGFAANNGTIVCNIGGGNVAKTVYRVSIFGHEESDIGTHRKDLLHGADEQERLTKRR